MDGEGSRQVVGPGSARATRIASGQQFTITDIAGKQVADMVAFVSVDAEHEWLSPTHTRSSRGRWKLRRGDELLTNLRRPILRLAHDDVGVHDMTFAMCDAVRYLKDYGITDHANCHDAMTAALIDHDIPAHRIPDPVNVFQNSHIATDGSIETEEPRSRAGDQVAFTALDDLLIVVSACPQDQNPCNGWAPSPVAVHVDNADNT
ncbi:MAG: DUF1989 domain-containing protein [Streptosporangiales bacterium]